MIRANFIVHPNFNEQGELTSAPVNQNFGANADKSIRQNLDNITSAETRVSAGVNTTAATIGTAVQDINSGNTNTIAAEGFDKLVDQSTRGEADFNEQARRTLETQGASWFKSNGVDFTESVNDVSSIGTSEKGGWDSNGSILGKAFAKTTGISGGVSINASQNTESAERMQFNSTNEVMSKFIDHANGDSAKLATYMNDFDKHVRELRADNTSSNTITDNINNDADDIIDKNKK